MYEYIFSENELQELKQCYDDKLTDKGIKIVSDILSNNYNAEYITIICPVKGGE